MPTATGSDFDHLYTHESDSSSEEEDVLLDDSENEQPPNGTKAVAEKGKDGKGGGASKRRKNKDSKKSKESNSKDGDKKDKKKKKFGIKSAVKRTFSMSSSGFASTLSGEGKGDDEAEPVVEIDVEIGKQAANMAQTRMEEILGRSSWIKRNNRMLDVACFSQDTFQVGSLVARGGFASVHKLSEWYCTSDLNEDDNEDKRYVIKSIKIAANRCKTPERLAFVAADMMMEAHFLATLDHPNILKLRGVSNDGLACFSRGRVDGLFLILDYLPYTLSKKIRQWEKAVEKDPSVNEQSLPERLQAAKDVSSALEYLHSKHIIYRDLKPSNAGFDVNGVLQLFDFGLAIEIPPSSDPNQVYNLAGKKGTARYMAPEVIKKRKSYNCKADIFSFSILLWQLVALDKPFGAQKTTDQAMRMILNGDRPSLKGIGSLNYDSDTKSTIHDLLARGWSKHIDERPTAEEIHDKLTKIMYDMKGEEVVVPAPVEISDDSQYGGLDDDFDDDAVVSVQDSAMPPEQQGTPEIDFLQYF